VKTGHNIANIKEIIDLLNSLKEKGIIEIVDSRISLKKRRIEDLQTKRLLELTKLERLNLLYILGKICQDEYEWRFFHVLLKQSDEEWEKLLPLTFIKDYIRIVRELSIMRKSFLLPPHLNDSESINSEIKFGAYVILRNFLSILLEYVEQVDRLLNENKEEATLRALLYLYPFLEPFIKEKEETMLKELKDQAEEKLNQKRKTLIITLPSNDVDNLIHDILDSLFDIIIWGEKLPAMPPFNIRKVIVPGFRGIARDREIAHEFKRLADTLCNIFFKDLIQEGRSEVEIELYDLLEKLEKKINQFNEYLLKFSFIVSLVWMNDTCPFMRDSIIDSNGTELTLCKNPECFVVYHKKCLDSLLKSGVKTCPICGTPIRS
jgi:hypothetical protein